MDPVVAVDTAEGQFSAGDPDQRWEIGSITKVFTGLLLAEMAASGLVGLNDPIAEHLPSGTSLGPGLSDVTLEHLACHRSGLPRLPPGLPRFSLSRRALADPYAGMDEEALLAALAKSTVRGRPGEVPVRYSNFGAGVLGYLLGRAARGMAGTSDAGRLSDAGREGDAGRLSDAGRKSDAVGRSGAAAVDPSDLDSASKQQAGATGSAHGHPAVDPDFVRALSERVLTPLRLNATDFTDNDLHQGRHRGKPVGPWHLAHLAGAGGLRSTANDLLLLLQSVRDGSGPLGPAIAETVRPRQQGRFGVGLGWFMLGDGRLLMHDGGTLGARTEVRIERPTGTLVVVLGDGKRGTARAAASLLNAT